MTLSLTGPSCGLVSAQLLQTLQQEKNHEISIVFHILFRILFHIFPYIIPYIIPYMSLCQQHQQTSTIEELPVEGWRLQQTPWGRDAGMLSKGWSSPTFIGSIQYVYYIIYNVYIYIYYICYNVYTYMYIYSVHKYSVYVRYSTQYKHSHSWQVEWPYPMTIPLNLIIAGWGWRWRLSRRVATCTESPWAAACKLVLDAWAKEMVLSLMGVAAMQLDWCWYVHQYTNNFLSKHIMYIYMYI